MNLFRKLLALLLVTAFAAVDSAYAKTIRVEAPSTQMTVKQARQALAESLNYLAASFGSRTVSKVKFTHHRVTFLDDTTACTVVFSEMSKLTVKTDRFGSVIQVNGKIFRLHREPGGNDSRDAWFSSEPKAKMFAEAVLILKAAALAPDPEEASFTAFAAHAKSWLAAMPKPEMPKEARTYKLVAEDAFKRKEFPAALDAYREALDKFPMWPEGHYNAALLAAEIEDFELAARHMRRYLMLAPDAKDAAAAEDKLLLWQHKAKE